jgi:hypothetical protein
VTSWEVLFGGTKSGQYCIIGAGSFQMVLELLSNARSCGIVISLELFDSRPLNLHLLDLVLVVYIMCCCIFCVFFLFLGLS